MFNNNVFGPVTSAPAIIYNDTNMSSDNISCTNLSGSIATFDQLEVVTFNPISFSADYAEITNLSCDNLSCQFKSTFGSISTGNISGTDISITGNLNASEVYAANISSATISGVLNISTPKLYVNDTFFYGSTGTIVASLVTMSSQVLYNLGDLDYKIISVTGTEYLTCDSTLGNINISNLSVDNLSTNLLNNISAGDRISLSTEAGTNKLVITSLGGLNSSNLSLDNLSVDNVSVTTYMTAQQLSVLNNLNVSNNLYVYGDGGAVGRVRVGAMDFKSSATNVKLADMEIYENQIDWNFKKDMYFYKDDASGQSLMTFKHSRGNVNISNCSIDNLSTQEVTVQEILYRNTPAGVKSYVSVNTGSVKQYHYSSWQFQKDNDAGIVFMKIDYAAENINISNLSCANISTNLLNNISAGENITLSTEAVTNKLVITATGGLNSSNLSLDNLSVDTAITTPSATITDLTTNRISLVPDQSFTPPIFEMTEGTAQITNANMSNLSVDNVSVAGELSTPTIRFKDNTQATKASWFVYPTAMEIYTQNDFKIRNQGFAGSPDFMFMDTSRNNVNISNLSVSHFDVEFVDLTNNLSDGNNININSVGGKAVISLQDPVNISTITTENMNVSGSAANFFDGANIYGTATVTNLVSDLTNTLSAGTNITITSVGGKAEISSTGGGGSVPANLSIDNLSVNFDATIGGDLKMLSADIIATSSELFIQDVTCTRNMSVSNALGANSIAASSSLTVGTNATVTGNITSTFGDIIAVTGKVFAPNVSGSIVTAGDLNVFNDATITRDLQVQRYLDAGKPTFVMLRRSNNFTLTGTGQPAIFNQNTSAQINGQFGTQNGSDVVVTTGGWYRVSWALGFKRVSNTGGDRIAVRSYSQKRTSGGGFTFDSFKNTISSSCYIRRNNLCREGHISGYNFLYIPANGAVRIIMECMVEGASTWTSSFNGMEERASSNLMVEFVSSAAET